MSPELKALKLYLANLVTMDDKTFDLCLDFTQTKQIKKGDYLVRAGNVCNEIAFINEGIFRIYYLKDGVEVNTCFCKENTIVSSLQSFTNKSISNDYIQALEDSTITTISNSSLAKLYKKDQSWQSIGRLFIEKECLRLSDRVNMLSFETALEKYNQLISTQPDIIQRVPIQYIATYIGVSRETLSRIRSKIT
ncbi:MAG: Crp/Fnr family transcriptional regulator [Crocinitomicaceae bacterium]